MHKHKKEFHIREGGVMKEFESLRAYALRHILVSKLLVHDLVHLNNWIKLLSCIIEANGSHIGLSHINLHWYY